MEIYSLTTCDNNVPTTILATSRENVRRLLHEHYSQIWDDLEPPHEKPESLSGLIETLRNFDILRNQHEVYIEAHIVLSSDIEFYDRLGL